MISELAITMVDVHGNKINSGNEVLVIIAGEVQYSATFKYKITNNVAIITKFGAGSHSYLTKYIAAAD